jgi:hypothetical protein
VVAAHGFRQAEITAAGTRQGHRRLACSPM